MASPALMRLPLALLALALASCGGAQQPATRSEPLILSIVGTNDLHGHIGALPLLGGYVANLRAARQADGGDVLLIDGGDMFQGTLESNLVEGAPIVQAYAALGYDAVAIGNHEFDYGPEGEHVSVREEGEHPRGALRARIAEAGFPFLCANLTHRDAPGEPLGVGERASVLLEREGGLSVGVVGITTEVTLSTTLAANVADLAMQESAARVQSEAEALRARGAALVVVAAHAGGNCTDFHDAHDLSSCVDDEEIFRLARALPPGLVDVIVAGHTHKGVAHIVNGIPIIESFSYGAAFGRVDLRVDPQTRRVIDVQVFAPQSLCSTEGVSAEAGLAACAPGLYEGAPVAEDARVRAIADRALAVADERRREPLGVLVSAPITRARERESALGNLFTDLMLEARPEGVAALMNGGGLRADLPEGPLTYGALYEAMPFDNRFAIATLRAGELAAFLAGRIGTEGSYFSLGGLRAHATCEEGEVRGVVLTRLSGEALAPEEEIRLVVSDFLATGGDGFLAAVAEREGGVFIDHEGETMRDGMARALRARSAPLDPSALLDPAAPRIRGCQ